MKISIKEIAAMIRADLQGDAEQEIHGFSPIENGREGTLSFLGNPKYESEIYKTKASAVIVSNHFKPSRDLNTTLLKVDNVYKSLAVLMQQFNKPREKLQGISNLAFVDQSADVSDDVYIGHFSVVSKNVSIKSGSQIYPQVFIGEDVQIGRNVKIFPGCRIHHHSVIGNDCVLFSNAVIGSDGFGYAPGEDGHYTAIPQVGNVVLEDQVEVGANTTIDRATLGSTIIHKGVKLDNLIQVGHNVEIDEHTVMAAQSGISGSSKIGKHCRIGGQVGFSGHLKVADKTQIVAQSGIMSDINEEGSALSGAPAYNHRQYFRSYAIFKQLPEMEKRLRELEKKLKESSK